MNYFGLFFTFMLPGIFLGIMGAAAIYQESRLARRKTARVKTVRPVHAAKQLPVSKSRLYIHDMSEST